MAFSPDGITIAACYGFDSLNNVASGGVVLWDATRHSRLQDQPLPVSEGSVATVAFSPDGKTLAAGYSAGQGGGVVLWDTARRSRLQAQPLAVPEGPKQLIPRGRVASVDFTPDGVAIAACYGSFDRGGVMLWDTARRSRFRDQVQAPYSGRFESVAFSPDGKTLAAGYGTGMDGGISLDYYGGVVLWDTVRHSRLQDQPLAVNGGEVRDIAFTPDGKTLAAGYVGSLGGGLGGVVLLDVDYASWRRRAGAIANRNFTRAEWQEYFPDQPYRKTFDWLPAAPPDQPTIVRHRRSAELESLPAPPPTASTRTD